VSDRRAYLTFHLISEEGKKAVKLISHVDWEEIPVASVSYSGSIDDMAAILAISSPGDGGRLLVDVGREARITTRGSRAEKTDYSSYGGALCTVDSIVLSSLTGN
jgi:hypothetical protein